MHGDLITFIEKARREGWMLIIHEINMLPTEVIEGALNSALTGDAHPGFGLIMTANDFEGRQKLSIPFLSRVKIKRAQSQSPQELLGLYPISPDNKEIILEAYQLTDGQASIRGLKNVIGHDQTGIDIYMACAMVFGLLQKEPAETKNNVTEFENKEQNIDFLKLTGSDRLIVSENPCQVSSGKLDVTRGKIEFLPPAPQCHGKRPAVTPSFNITAQSAFSDCNRDGN